MSRTITEGELFEDLVHLRQEIDVLFRSVEGPRRAYIFGGPLSSGERGVYQVIGLAAEIENPAEEERYGLALIRSMEYIFQQLWLRGARTIAWRRDLELSIASGGDRLPDLMRISCRICAFDVNGVRVDVGEWEWLEGTPSKVMTREALEDMCA